MPPTQVQFPGASRDFSPRANFQCRLSYSVRTPPCAIACIYICTHAKDPVVHVRVRWIMETLKHLACTIGWVARLCRSCSSPGKAARIFHGRNPIGTIQLWKEEEEEEEEKKEEILSCSYEEHDWTNWPWISFALPVLRCRELLNTCHSAPIHILFSSKK